MGEQSVIKLLRFPENVRMRKEMYLFNCNHCITEIVDNAIDEFNAGYAKHIKVAVKHVEGEAFPVITVWDDGRGIPTKLSDDPEHLTETQAEVALGNLTAGGKFGQEDGYKTVTTGLHGVGASCVNATSSRFDAVIYHYGTRTVLQYEQGILKNRQVEEQISNKKIQGTEITFLLDDSLWKDEQYNLREIRDRLEQLSYLNPGLEITYEQGGNTDVFVHEKGIEDYYEHLIKSKNMLGDERGDGKETKPVHIWKTVHDDQVGDIEADIIFGYSNGYGRDDVYGFVNSVHTRSGDHFTGFTTAVSGAIRSFYTVEDKHKAMLNKLKNEDCYEGLVAILSIKVMYPKFEGQSKGSIKMPQVRAAVNSLVKEEFQFYLEEHPSFVKLLADKLEKASKSRMAAEQARRRVRGEKTTLDASLPGKLAGCSSKVPAECSLYLVEGDSAAGSAIQGRDSRTQAILPVFGKILNTEKSRPDEVVTNSKLLDVVKALRTGIGSEFNLAKLRYHKIIIMADADVDGFHISTLWITFFYRHMPQLVENGHLYIALSPIYRVTEYVGKKEVNHYFFDDKEFEAFHTKNKVHVSYIKGLGELQPQQLWESTMDPQNRRLIRVNVQDAIQASDAISMCMGEDVGVRREFIMANADFEKAVD